jgi:hypothetical protein
MNNCVCVQVSLDNSECELNDGVVGGPLYRPLSGLEPLHRHQAEAVRQQRELRHTADHHWTDQARQTWDLIAALWGRMEDQVQFHTKLPMYVPIPCEIFLRTEKFAFT